MLDLTHALVALQPRFEMLQATLNASIKIMEADGGALLTTIIDKQKVRRGAFNLEAFEGWTPMGRPPYQFQGLLANRAIKEKRLIVCNDYQNMKGAVPDVVLAGAKVLLALPLIKGELTHGVLILFFRDENRRISKSEITMLDMIGHMAAIAMHNAIVMNTNKSEQVKLQAILESVPVGIEIYDTNGEFVTQNYAAVQILHPLSKNHEGGLQAHLTRFRFRHPNQTEYLPEEWPAQRALNGEWVKAEEIHYTHPSRGEIIALVSALPLINLNGEIEQVIVLYEEITHWIEAERVKSQFLDIAAHELKSPITALSLLIQRLQRTAQADQPADTMLIERMDKQVYRLTSLLNELIDVARLEKEDLNYEMESLDLVKLLKDTIAEFKMTCNDHYVNMNIKGSLKEAMVEGNRTRLQQVVLNLLDNACKYSSYGTNIDVVLSEYPVGFYQVAVQDFGPGIPSRDQEIIFSRYYRARKRGMQKEPGLGLGLYIASEIIAVHGGRIWVKSSEKQGGSTFFFTLPSARIYSSIH